MQFSKTKTYTKFVITAILVVLLSGIFTSIAHAQEETGTLEYTDVDLWIYPEFDDPRLLVMLQGQIVGATPPATVEFLVPSTAEMYSAGSMDAQGNYTGGPPNREPSDISGWDIISYEVTTDTFRVEYYDSIIIGTPDKSISYEFRWLNPISDISVVVQEPRSSTGFIVLPEGKIFTDGYGLTAHLYNYTDLNDMQPLDFEISYTRTDTAPSLSTDSGRLSGYWYVVIILAVILIIAAVYYFFLRHRTNEKPVKFRAERRRKKNTPGGARARFCTQCGHELEETNLYCPNCGQKR